MLSLGVLRQPRIKPIIAAALTVSSSSPRGRRGKRSHWRQKLVSFQPGSSTLGAEFFSSVTADNHSGRLGVPLRSAAQLCAALRSRRRANDIQQASHVVYRLFLFSFHNKIMTCPGIACICSSAWRSRREERGRCGHPYWLLQHWIPLISRSSFSFRFSAGPESRLS